MGKQTDSYMSYINIRNNIWSTLSDNPTPEPVDKSPSATDETEKRGSDDTSGYKHKKLVATNEVDSEGEYIIPSKANVASENESNENTTTKVAQISPASTSTTNIPPVPDDTQTVPVVDKALVEFDNPDVLTRSVAFW
jgi:hypothetical protein